METGRSGPKYESEKKVWNTNVWSRVAHQHSEPSDGSPTRIPTLNSKDSDGRPTHANTNDAKSKVLANAFFPPLPASPPTFDGYTYPTPVSDPGDITTEQIERCIKKLSPMKAPGPDGIKNVVFKKCTDALTPQLLRLFQAIFLLKTYYNPWRDFTTIVLRKPGKPDYAIPKAYRPIALLNTTGKLLTAVIADQLTYLLESNNLLPPTHFGGRPGCSTTDSLHLLEATIKNAWRAGKVASVLFLDIEGAFPNAVTNRLIHNMRKRRIPTSLTNFTERVLTGRRTKLSFDGFLSDWIPITNGIGQGDPLSMILYIIYNSDLVDVPKNKNETALAFVDDTAYLTIGADFASTHAALTDMLERPNGAFNWSTDHNSRFETSKFALIDFSMNKSKERPIMNIRGNLIKPTDTHRFLGVLLDEGLRWHKHVTYAIGKGTAYVLQLRRISRSSKGIPLTLSRQLYTSVALPKMLYALDLWFKPIYTGDSDTVIRGSIGTSKRMGRVQRLAAISITGAFNTTATDAAEAHAKLIPLAQRAQTLCHRAVLRLAAHPPSHPIHPLIHRATKCNVKHHRSSLHNLISSFHIAPSKIETIVPARRAPTSTSPLTTHVAPDKDESIREHNNIDTGTRVYSDGSGLNGKIGASAVLYQTRQAPKTLRYHLGSDSEHTVYEAEVVGMTLAAQLLLTKRDVELPINIFVDNQAAIKSGDVFTTKSGHYLIDKFNNIIRAIRRKHKCSKSDITLRWVAAHKDVLGNERADVEAKKAATDTNSTSSHKRQP